MIDNKYVMDVFEILHQMPEKSLEEYKTAKYLADQLEEMGYQVIREVQNSTGVIGILDSGKPGKIIGLRADIDALPFEEEGKTVYRHACGHDAHAAMVLTVAKRLIEKGIEAGKVYIIFQPAEELGVGARLMIASGWLSDMEEIVGMHIRPLEDTGFGKVSPAMYHSSTRHVTVKFTGESAHAARPHLGINAADAAVLCVNAANAIKGSPYISHSLKVTRISTGGTSINTIPAEAVVSFDLRCVDNEEAKRIYSILLEAIASSAKAVGAQYDILQDGGVPASVYDPDMIEDAKKAIIEVVGEDNLYGDITTAGGEDFHFFSLELGAKACYLGLGADAQPGLHDPNMTFNHDAMKIGAQVLYNLVTKRLKK